MKKLLLVMLLGASSLGFAQDMFFRADGGIGFATTFGKLRSYGVNASSEFKLFFNENIAAGVRVEGNALFGAKIAATEDINVGVSARTAYLLKGEYHFGQGNTKPYVGLLAGHYRNASVSVGTGGIGAIVYQGWGGAPEVGVEFGGRFRMSAMYHHVFGKDDVSVTLSTGMSETVSLGRGYFVFSLGFKVWGTE